MNTQCVGCQHYEDNQMGDEQCVKPHGAPCPAAEAQAAARRIRYAEWYEEER